MENLSDWLRLLDKFLQIFGTLALWHFDPPIRRLLDKVPSFLLADQQSKNRGTARDNFQKPLQYTLHSDQKYSALVAHQQDSHILQKHFKRIWTILHQIAD